MAALEIEHRSGNNVTRLNIGPGTGTGEDFQGRLAARLELTFLNNANVSAASTQAGFLMRAYDVNSLAPSYWYKIIDMPAANGKSHVRVSVALDSQGKRMLEEHVNIHVYDLSTPGIITLTNIINTGNEGTDITVPVNSVLFALIQPRIVTEGGNEVDIFEIGDPRTDARVKITEEDV